MPDVREAYVINIMYVVGYSETCIHHVLRDCGKKIIKVGISQLQISFNSIRFIGTTAN
jgi:hypothetical protein